MMPVRCYTCNAVVAHLWEAYESQRQAQDTQATGSLLDDLGVRRMCCRRMFLGHVDLTKEHILHPNKDVVLDDSGTHLRRKVHFERTISCE